MDHLTEQEQTAANSAHDHCTGGGADNFARGTAEGFGELVARKLGVADGKRRPVVFYNHGGGYMIGSGAATGQDGTNFAKLYDVVVVQTNHRLGLLGCLSLGDLADCGYAANQGMLDILVALRWTSENIENFGGPSAGRTLYGVTTTLPTTSPFAKR